MGACDFLITANAFSAYSAFDSLCREAREEYGNDSYNGTISTTCLTTKDAFWGRYKDTKWSQKIDKEICSFIGKDLNNVPKWECKCINGGYINQFLVTREVNFDKGVPAKGLFEVYCYDENGGELPIRVFHSKDEIKEWFRKSTNFGDNNTYSIYSVRKIGAEAGKRTKVGVAFYNFTEIKRTLTRTLSVDEKVMYMYKYYFYGWAAQ